MIKKLTYILCLLVIITPKLWAQNLAVASIFGDKMVIQKGIKAPIWGTAKANQEIKIAFAGKVVTAMSNTDGKWMAHLAIYKAGGPYQMVISSEQSTITFNDVLIGEVWLASGQSNMQFKVSELDKSDVVASEANYPKIRFFNVKQNISNKSLDKVNGSWQTCNPINVKTFSAVAYFFAKELNQSKKIPVGVISSSWGATPVEAWTSAESLINHPDFKDSVTRYQKLQEDWEQLYHNYLKVAEDSKIANKKAPTMIPQKNYPTALYNAMIAPIIPYGIKGIIWYQGENNASRAIQYRTLFPLLINDWRAKWDNPQLPFLFVQLANFRARNQEPVFKDDWALLREAQGMALKLPHTGMAVAIDIGDAKTIHPLNKQDVGKRLFIAANHVAYHQSGVYAGPMYQNMKVKNDKIIISFTQTGSGLMFKGQKLEGFAIAGEDKKFYWANADIDGDKIIISCKDVNKPVAVRYAWATNPPCNLYNLEDLPAAPFRTDNW